MDFVTSPRTRIVLLLFVDCENLYDKQGERVVGLLIRGVCAEDMRLLRLLSARRQLLLMWKGMPRIFTDAEYAEIGSLEKVLSDEDDIGTWNTLKLQELTSISSDFVYCIS
ncbi:hypothetical protein OROMI_007954 [Orobanche minor]